MSNFLLLADTGKAVGVLQIAGSNFCDPATNEPEKRFAIIIRAYALSDELKDVPLELAAPKIVTTGITGTGWAIDVKLPEGTKAVHVSDPQLQAHMGHAMTMRVKPE
jgi:hypothetical protein